jgi:hypothetical protein
MSTSFELYECDKQLKYIISIEFKHQSFSLVVINGLMSFTLQDYHNYNIELLPPERICTSARK